MNQANKTNRRAKNRAENSPVLNHSGVASRVIKLAMTSLVAVGSANVLGFSAWASDRFTDVIDAKVEKSIEAPALSEAYNDSTKDSTTTTLETTTAAAQLQQAANLAAQAQRLAQRARSAADWDAVMAQWLEAIALAQSIPPESPSRIVAQRQMRGYLQQLLEVQRRTEQASPTSGLPSLGSDVFDSQLAGYFSYVATMGTPDVLIVGSSRALQGIDPQVMQQALAGRGYPNLKVFNFSVNGATAQVVNFVIRELLPAPLPAVIVWGDGSRAFNDGRRDRTWESVTASPGYQAIRSGALPNALFLETLTPTATSFQSGPVSGTTASGTTASGIIVTARSPLPNVSGNLDALGFSAVGDRFVPQTYYQQFPQVLGRYDGAYSPFQLYGPQTAALAELSGFAKAQNARLIFVNLPLSGSYLDDYRLYYEGQFQQFLRAQSAALGFGVVDLLTQWRSQPALFADPSHLNQEGAAAIANQLAQDTKILAALNSREIDTENQEIRPENGTESDTESETENSLNKSLKGEQ